MGMKQEISKLIESALTSLQQQEKLPRDADVVKLITLDKTKDPSFGDFACNIAMMLAKIARRKPRDIAADIALEINAIITKPEQKTKVKKIDIAGPGFINFFLADNSYHSVLDSIATEKDNYGRCGIGAGKRVMVEFVSANPTGPLHVGHGRGATYGACVADLLEAVGFDVYREYYVNDAGRQMSILSASVWLRYLSLAGEEVKFPVNGYQGDYIWDIAATLHREYQDKYRCEFSKVVENVVADEDAGGDKEAHIDGVINFASHFLGDDVFRLVLDTALEAILGDIKQDLEGFGVVYQNWFSERSLMDNDYLAKTLKTLEDKDWIYQKNGAKWFRSTKLGDEKDRVVVRYNGQMTYFASDIAYHMNKFERGFDTLIDIWGADHHGYVPRVKAGIQAAGGDETKLDVLLVQFASLFRQGEKVAMSTRSGKFVTLRELRDEVGADAARFFYVMRRCEQHMDFDLDLAKSKANENPLFYVQYAHARVCSVMRLLTEKSLSFDPSKADYAVLNLEIEIKLMKSLSEYGEILQTAALQHEPHRVIHYLRALASDFHTYYNAHQFLVAEDTIRHTRLVLINSVSQVVRNGLVLLGVSAPESM
jgi:arginyl-tRNA synthetase